MTDQAISDFDLYSFGEGNHQRIYEKLGAHVDSPGAQDSGAPIVCVFNATPVPRDNYEIGVADSGSYRKLFDSDQVGFGGSGYNRQSQVEASTDGASGHPLSLKLNLPPLAAMFFTEISA